MSNYLLGLASGLVITWMQAVMLLAWTRPKRMRLVVQITGREVLGYITTAFLGGLMFFVWRYLPGTPGTAAFKLWIDPWPGVVFVLTSLVMATPFLVVYLVGLADRVAHAEEEQRKNDLQRVSDDRHHGPDV